MFIFEDIDCPLCNGKIEVVVENNKIVSHGICPTCDETFSSERLQFTTDCQAMEAEFMFDLGVEELDHALDLFNQVDIEVDDFYYQLAWHIGRAI